MDAGSVVYPILGMSAFTYAGLNVVSYLTVTYESEERGEGIVYFPREVGLDDSLTKKEKMEKIKEELVDSFGKFSGNATYQVGRLGYSLGLNKLKKKLQGDKE